MIKQRNCAVGFTFILLAISVLVQANHDYFQHGCPYIHQLRQRAMDLLPAESTIPHTLTPYRNMPAPGYPGVTIGSWLQHYFSDNIVHGNAIARPQISHMQSPSMMSDNDLMKGLFPSKKSKKLKCGIPPLICGNETKIYRKMDGSCNNLQYTGFGMAKARHVRLLPPNFGDGFSSPSESASGNPLPNPRSLSLTLFGDDTLPDSYRTLITMQWGQMVAHDISQLAKNSAAPTDCCKNAHDKLCYPIPMHPQDPIALGSGKKCLSFSRSVSEADAEDCPASNYNYPEKISLPTAFLDLSAIYGNSDEEGKKLREMRGGLLKTSTYNNRKWLPISMNENGECGEDHHQCYILADLRNQFTPVIIALHTIFVREHNRIANVLSQLNPHYSDEILYQEARRINIAEYQKISYYDWLPLIMGTTYAYDNGLIHYVQTDDYVHDYDETVNAAPIVECVASALRYLHTQIPGWFSLVNPNRSYNRTMRLSDYFQRSENMEFIADGGNFDSLLRGLATQLQKNTDDNIDKEIKHHFNRKSFEEYGSDLRAIDIQRGRDYGVPSYNDVRHYCGLPRAYNWAGFAREISPAKLDWLQKFYESPHDVDLSVGGSLERHLPDSLLGPTFQCVVTKQLIRTRTGDRFFFEHDEIGGFTREQLVEIRKSSMSSLLCNNGDYLQYIQPNAFIFPNSRNILKSCDAIPHLDLTKWKQDPKTA